MTMQGIYARMNRSPLEVRYWSCVPYLLGEGQAMKYSVTPTSGLKDKDSVESAGRLVAPVTGTNTFAA